MIGLGVEVAFSLNGAIVLPRRIFELDANPLLWREVCEARVADNARAVIIELNSLARFEGSKVDHCVGKN